MLPQTKTKMTYTAIILGLVYLANNILKKGMEIISEGAADYMGGAMVRPEFFGTGDETQSLLNLQGMHNYHTLYKARPWAIFMTAGRRTLPT